MCTYGSDFYYFSTFLLLLQTSSSSFRKFFFLGSLTREEGEAIFENWKEWPRLLGKMPRLRVAMGKFIIKNAVLRVPRWKNAPNVSPYAILFICCSSNVYQSGLISRSLLCPENWLHAWSTTMVGWQSKRFTAGTVTLWQRCGTVENESCADVSFWRCDNVALRRYQDFATTLLQRHRNINHWISRPFYYGTFWFLSLHQNVRELRKC